METVLFAVFGLAAILAALLTITSPAPITSALYLVVTLFSAAGLYVLLAAPFVAAIQIIVYAGAVIVLILFVVMLLNLNAIDEKIPARWLVPAIAISALTLITMFLAVMNVGSVPAAPPLSAAFGKVSEVGSLLFTKYLYAFEVVSVLLLLAVIGAVGLIHKQDTGGSDAR
jgi:NADH-quinone oxidoreductase subunit J